MTCIFANKSDQKVSIKIFCENILSISQNNLLSIFLLAVTAYMLFQYIIFSKAIRKFTKACHENIYYQYFSH